MNTSRTFSPARLLPRPFGGAAPVVVIVVALAASAAVFFFYTRHKLNPQANGTVQTAPGEAGASAAGAASSGTAGSGANGTVPSAAGVAAGQPGARSPAMTGAAGGANVAAGASAPAAGNASAGANSGPLPGFARPLDLGKGLAQSLASGDTSGAARMAPQADAASSAAVATVLDKIFKGLNYKVGPEDKVVLMGQIDSATRISIPLMKPGETTPSTSIQVDVERDPKMGWKISKFHLPKELSTALAQAMAAAPAPMAGTPGAAPAAGTVGSATAAGSTGAGAPATAAGAVAAAAPGAGATVGTPAPGAIAGMSAAGASAAGAPKMTAPAGLPSLFVIDAVPDALSYASEFVHALLKLDFVSARKYVDNSKVAAQKLAGLCIVFEEGQYELKPNKPMVITVASPQVSWVIAQVQSEKLQPTEFGIEMQRDRDDQPWRIVGLNLSDLLSSFGKSASRLGVPYTPIVTNPKGGESLALYFEYDQAGLHPRARKQLEIVAGLLKSNGSRKLHITGHTDALGSDGYNIGLSQGRATSVKAELVALGVSPEQVVTEGLGKASPLGPNQKSDGTDDPEGRSKNRRAEIYLDF